MKTEIAMDATDLTQLSSREQLSALMDGALPADETRFLLRRLQHDASLAECWERWRLSAEVMRGLAPAQRLPADFASRVATSLRAELHGNEGVAADVATGKRTTAVQPWLRWGGGAALAASLVVAAFMNQPGTVKLPAKASGNIAVATVPVLTSDAIAIAASSTQKTPAPQAPAQDPVGTGIESQTAALASAVAAVARPVRNSRRNNQSAAMQASAILMPATEARSAGVAIAAANNTPALLPPTDIVTRPWPRSVLPQYGSAGITVGFGDSTRNTAPNNPFQSRTSIGGLPPTMIGGFSGPAETSAPREHGNDGQDGVANGTSPPES